MTTDEENTMLLTDSLLLPTEQLSVTTSLAAVPLEPTLYRAQAGVGALGQVFRLVQGTPVRAALLSS